MVVKKGANLANYMATAHTACSLCQSYNFDKYIQRNAFHISIGVFGARLCVVQCLPCSLVYINMTGAVIGQTSLIVCQKSYIAHCAPLFRGRVQGTTYRALTCTEISLFSTGPLSHVKTVRLFRGALPRFVYSYYHRKMAEDSRSRTYEDH